ncbi:MAG TPA: alpha/beta fold hydrolase [Candidatus Limnocylindrales bacterium]|nr:alpha/beta fold hydrolase [Candidatus Limnocylindrales bacterium]
MTSKAGAPSAAAVLADRPGIEQPTTPEIFERLAPRFSELAAGTQVTGTPGEQSRARYPDEEGRLERDGVQIFWESYGQDEPAILLFPTWMIVHSRIWKMQIPFLARHHRVVTWDPRGNGRSDRPTDVTSYHQKETLDDALVLMDRLGIERAVVVGFSLGADHVLHFAAEHPERVLGVVTIGASMPLDTPPIPSRAEAFTRILDQPARTDGWFKTNLDYWRDPQGYLDYVRFFFGQLFSEPRSTKGYEDAVGWALETTGETLATEAAADSIASTADETIEMLQRVKAPVLAIHGTDDRISPFQRSERVAELTGGRVALLEGSGHGPLVRDPVKVNELIEEFIGGLRSESGAPIPRRPRRWTRGSSRQRRALYISSPIGLGHAQRDVAIARELRRLHPDLEIDWLAQHPVTQVLEVNGERVHPASAMLASESGHIESESAEHDLHCFQAIRRMDEILLANFMVLRDVVKDAHYDVWIGDESWELDYYLHENPELKTAAYAWMTDFVGWLPMTDGGDSEAAITADYNAEMIEHIARYPRIRDRAIFVGNLDDIVPDSFGPGLPRIRDWTLEHYAFSGYVTGFDADEFADRPASRAQLGYAADEKVCIVSVGGTGVGVDLLRRVIDAYPEVRRRVPELRMIVVAGPRIDPATLPQMPGVEVRAFVPGLYRHLAACDIAVVQGGLSTTMELAANGRPFLYFPLRHHFEQNFHVRHRLERYGAGRCMDYATATPEVIAEAVASELRRPPQRLRVERDGAERAAKLIAELL